MTTCQAERIERPSSCPPPGYLLGDSLVRAHRDGVLVSYCQSAITVSPFSFRNCGSSRASGSTNTQRVHGAACARILAPCREGDPLLPHSGSLAADRRVVVLSSHPVRQIQAQETVAPNPAPVPRERAEPLVTPLTSTTSTASTPHERIIAQRNDDILRFDTYFAADF